MLAMRARVHSHNSPLSLTFKILDAAAIALGLAWSLYVQPQLNSDSTFIGCLVAIATFSISAELMGLYRNWQAALGRESAYLLGTWLVTLVVLVGVGRFSYSTLEFSLNSLALWALVTPIFALSARVLVRQGLRLLVKYDVGARRYAIYGATELGAQLAQGIEKSPDLGFKFSGFFDDRPEQRSAELPEPFAKRLGKLEELVEQARAGQVEVVFIALPLAAEERIREIIRLLGDTTVSAYLVPDLFTFQLLHCRWMDANGIPVVSIFENPLYGVDGVLKRISDICFSSLAILIFGLPMLAIAAAVKLTSRGPVIFKQKRYGMDGREFSVWKFRSMTVCENGDRVVQATKNDSRLTPIGGFLRKSSLDELPQLFNVLMGTMSIVGPRPHATAHNEYYRQQIEGYMLRHKVKPGITGLAQVNGCRGETETMEKMERRVHFDHRYIREWTLLLDLRIIFRTFLVVFSRENAY